MYSHTNIHQKSQTFILTLGWMTKKEASNVLCTIQELDPDATSAGRATGTVLNNERVSKHMFVFMIEQGSQKELFFKLKLKYSDFILHPTAGHAMLTAYGSD